MRQQFSWQLGTNTKLTFEGEYLSTRRPNLFGSSLPLKGTLLPNPNGKISPNTYLGDPTVDKTIQTEGRIGYNFEHSFSNNWSLQNSVRYAFNQIFGTAVNPGGLGADNRTIGRIYYVYQPYTAGTYSQDTHLVGKFTTFGIAHQLLVGVDGYHTIVAPLKYSVYNFPSIDVYNPVYGQTIGAFLGSNSFKSINDQVGVYVQDQLTLANNLKLVMGGREDFDQTKFLSLGQTGGITSASEDSRFAFSPRVGIVYQPIQPISLYASYSRSFQPGYGTDFNHKPFKPVYGIQYEVGVKTDWLKDKLSTTLAFYQLTQANVATADLDHPGFAVQVGEARSKGVEFSVTGELAPGWNIIGSYNYTDAQITSDNSGLAGKVFPNAPYNSASIWTNYIFQKGDLKGFGGGLGVFFVGDRFGDTTNTYKEPSYVRTDAALYYRRNNFQAALNFKNLFDVLYYESGTYRGEPFGAELSFKWQL